MPNFLQRLAARLRNRRFDEDLAEELRMHEELKREELERAGVAPRDARSEARRALGNVTLMREEARGVWVRPWIESIGQDARYAVRTLAHQPLHTLTALGVLVLAISMIASLFTAFKALSLAPWPADDPDHIVRIMATAGGERIGPSVDEYLFIREHATTLEGVAAYVSAGGTLTAPGRAAIDSKSRLVSANFLDVLGARMHLGTGLLPGDDEPGGRAVAIISYDLWRTYFAGDPAVVGQAVTLNKTSFTVIGVLEPKIDGLEHPVRVWLPLSALPATNLVMAAGIEGAARTACCIDMVGRLAKGISRERARSDVQMLHERFTMAGKRKTGLVALHGTAYADGPGDDMAVMWALFSALGLVLILACANVGNLQLARGLARRREIATRAAIGASRSRIVRQLLVEGLVLAAAAGAASVAVAALLPAAVLGLMGQEIPPTRAARFVPDWQVIALTAAICLASCLAFALAPALHATRRTIPLGTLDRSSTRRGRFHLRGGLLAVQIAMCTVLLVGAGLVTRAIAHAMEFDPGFRIDGVERVLVSLPSETAAAQRRQFSEQLLAALEDTEPVAVAGHGPVAPNGFFTANLIRADENVTDYRSVELRGVSRRYFEVLGIPLTSGRTFASDAVGEAVVNETFARMHWRGAAALGQIVREVDQSGRVARAYPSWGLSVMPTSPGSSVSSR